MVVSFFQEKATMEPNVRLNVTLSPYDYERLKLWALTHGKTATAYASQVIAARIESNFETIERQLESFAKSRGMTVEDLKEIALSEDD